MVAACTFRGGRECDMFNFSRSLPVGVKVRALDVVRITPYTGPIPIQVVVAMLA